MPKVYLTLEDKKQALLEKRDRYLQALIESKMKENGIAFSTIERTLNLKQGAVYYRLRKPSERFNVLELSLLVNVLKISNEELCHAVRI